MKKKIYVRGSDKNPQKVIDTLVKRGGISYYDYKGDDPNLLYYIDKLHRIVYTSDQETIYDMLIEYGEELFPEPDYKFKVGDKVKGKASGDVFFVEELLNVKGCAYYKMHNSNSGIAIPEMNLELCTEDDLLTWDDIENEMDFVYGHRIGVNSVTNLVNCSSHESKNIFRTKAQAKSALAMAQISHLIELPAYGGWCPIGEPGYIIDLYNLKHLHVSSCFRCLGGILRFKTKHAAELFIEHNEELVKDYLMID